MASQQENQTHTRQLLELQLATYARIVGRKHGVILSVALDDAVKWSDEDLATYVEALKDLAHLPPV